jgi:hypothetical protein
MHGWIEQRIREENPELGDALTRGRMVGAGMATAGLTAFVAGYYAPEVIAAISPYINKFKNKINKLLRIIKSRKPTSGQLRAYERQLRVQGRDSLLKSRKTLLRRLAKHLKDLKNYKKAGGYTSKTLTEIRNFRQQVKAIDKVLEKNK